MRNKFKRIIALFLAVLMVVSSDSTLTLINAAQTDATETTEVTEIPEATVTPEVTATPEATETPEIEDPDKESVYVVNVTVPEGEFYVGETSKTPFTASITKDGVPVTGDIRWSCDTNAVITSDGNLTVNADAVAGTEITVTAAYTQENGTEVTGSATVTVSAREMYTVSGVVKDNYTGEILEGVTVSFEQTQIPFNQNVTAVTNKSGEYSATLYKGIEYTQKVDTNGKYKVWEKTGSNENLGGDILLEHNIDFSFNIDGSINMSVGDTILVGINFTEAQWNGSNVSWSSDSGVISVTGNGTVSAVKKGEATLTATCRNVQKSIKVIVNGYHDYSITSKVTTTGGKTINEENKVYPVVEGRKDNTKVYVTAGITVKNNQGITSTVEKEKITFIPQKLNSKGEYEDLTDQKKEITEKFNEAQEFEFKTSGTYCFKIIFEGEKDKWDNESYTKTSAPFEVSTIPGQSIAFQDVESLIYGSENETEVKSIDFTAVVAESDAEKYELTPVAISGKEKVESLSVNIEKSTKKDKFYEVTGKVSFVLNDVTAEGELIRILLKYSHKNQETKGDLIYTDAESSTTFAVLPKTVTVNSIEYGEKEYDGTDAAVIESITLSGVESRDENLVSVGTTGLKYDSTNAGTSHYIVLTEENNMQLTGESARKYVLKDLDNLNDDLRAEAMRNGVIAQRKISITSTVNLTKEYYTPNPESAEIAEKVSYGDFVAGEEELAAYIQNWTPEFSVTSTLESPIYDEYGKAIKYDVLASNPDPKKEKPDALSNYTFDLNGDGNGTDIGDLTIVVNNASFEEDYEFTGNGIIKIGDIIYLKKGISKEELQIVRPVEETKYNKVEYSDCQSNEAEGTVSFKLLKQIGETVVAESEETVLTCVTDGQVEVKVEVAVNDGEASVFDKILDTLTFGIWGQNGNTKAKVVYSDTQSGLNDCQYYTVIDYSELENQKDLITYLNSYTGWTEVKANSNSVDVNVNGLDEDGHKVIVAKAVDNVGNVQYATSTGVVIDTQIPEVLTLNIKDGVDGKFVTNKDVEIEVTGANDYFDETKAYSGIKKISYVAKLTVNGKMQEVNYAEGVIYDAETPEGLATLEELKNQANTTTALKTIVIPVDKSEDSPLGKNNTDTNVIEVIVTAEDYTGNVSEEEAVQFHVCIADPSVDVEFNGEVKNDKYFNSDRTATITVTSAYFDPQTIKWTGVDNTQATDWVEVKNEPYTYMTTRTYCTDGDHEFGMEVTDMAGNIGTVSKETKPTKPDHYWDFTLDKTAPVIVDIKFYEKVGTNYKCIESTLTERYYSADKIYADILIKEHNFLEDPKLNITATKQTDDYVEPEYRWLSSEEDSRVSEDMHVLRIEFKSDANYTFDMSYIDLAENDLESDFTEKLLTVDRIDPTGTITFSGLGYYVDGEGAGKIDEWIRDWAKLVDNITFGLFSKTVEVTIDGTDTIAGVKDIQYVYSNRKLSESELDDAKWISVKEGMDPLEPNQKVIVYGKIIDNSSNYRYISSDGIILDDTADKPKITITTPKPLNYIYDNSVDIFIEATDKGVNESDAFAGLYDVRYVISTPDDKEQNITVGNIKINPDDLSYAAGNITIDGDKYYSNNIQVCVTVTDRAGNIAEEKLEVAIDNKDPVVDFAFDTSDCKYEHDDVQCYNTAKELKITVEERNFDTNDKNRPVVSTESQKNDGYSISGWKKEKDETYTCTVNFTESDDYTVSYQTYDLAGNPSELKILETFTIDTVEPTVKSYEVATEESTEAIESYFNKDVNVEFEIQERFLAKDKVKLAFTKDGVNYVYTLEQLETEEVQNELGLKAVNAEMTDGLSDASTSKVTLTFASKKDDNPLESDYQVKLVSIEDQLGWTGDTKGRELEFHIDTKAPVQKYAYYKVNKGVETEITASADEQNPTYVNRDYESFIAILEVEEKNFAFENQTTSEMQMNNVYTVTRKNSGTDVEDSEDIVENENKYDAWKHEGTKHSYTQTISDDAQYSFQYLMYDNAGNKCEAQNIDYVTLDKTNPEGTIKVSGLVNDPTEEDTTWINKFIEKITFGLFAKNSATANISSSDITSGVATSQYYITKDSMSETDLRKKDANNEIPWKSYTEAEISEALTANNQAIVYQKVVDRAGNDAFYSSNVLVIDNKNPLPVITINPGIPKWNKGVFKVDDNPGFDVVVQEQRGEDGSYAGLREVVITIKNGTTGYKTTITKEYGKGDHQPNYSEHINIAAYGIENFYSNDVQITVTAKDWSTNEAVSETAHMKIDTKAPIVKFSFDTSDVQNGKYYKNVKTLTITVDERNFDRSYTPTVKSSTNGGYTFNGWNTSGETTTGTITFSGNSDYTVTFDCYDLAGNKSNTETLAEFTVDREAPVISVSYDNNSSMNGNYYKAARTATITITEHNFRASDVVVTTSASNGSAPSVRGWSSSGDRHTATVYFGSDADYSFDISYKDLATNPAADYAEDKFTVDLTNPVVEITGVADKSANKDTVAPVIRIEDTNYSANDVTITLIGAQKGKINIDSMISRTSTENGQIISFNNFADDMDDVYTLTVKAVDKAGNETTKSIMFSVNRHGSTYAINKATKKMLDKGYTKNAVSVIIEETNVDTLEFVELSYSKDGKIVKLTEGKDYTIKVEGGEGQWKKYTYTIFESCFTEEGKYSINITSIDRAQNESNNKVQSFNVEFVVDKTAPTLAVSNLEDNKTYDTDLHQFIINVKDNTKLSKVELYIDGKLYYTYKGDELTVENGKIYIDIENNGNEWQTIKLIAYDEADNPTEPIEYRVLVTANAWTQFLNNKPALYGTLAGLVAAAFVIFFIIWKRKKDKEEKAA